MMHHYCAEGLEDDRDMLVEDFGKTIRFEALSPEGRVWLEEVPGERRGVLVLRDRTLAAKLVHQMLKAGLQFRISVAAHVLDKTELLSAAYYGAATVQ